MVGLILGLSFLQNKLKIPQILLMQKSSAKSSVDLFTRSRLQVNIEDEFMFLGFWLRLIWKCDMDLFHFVC